MFLVGGHEAGDAKLGDRLEDDAGGQQASLRAGVGGVVLHHDGQGPPQRRAPGRGQPIKRPGYQLAQVWIGGQLRRRNQLPWDQGEARRVAYAGRPSGWRRRPRRYSGGQQP